MTSVRGNRGHSGQGQNSPDQTESDFPLTCVSPSTRCSPVQDPAEWLLPSSGWRIRRITSSGTVCPTKSVNHAPRPTANCNQAERFALHLHRCLQTFSACLQTLVGCAPSEECTLPFSRFIRFVDKNCSQFHRAVAIHLLRSTVPTTLRSISVLPAKAGRKRLAAGLTCLTSSSSSSWPADPDQAECREAYGLPFSDLPDCTGPPAQVRLSAWLSVCVPTVKLSMHDFGESRWMRTVRPVDRESSS